MTRYRTKPAGVEARQLTGSNSDIHDVYLWIERAIGSVPPPCDDEKNGGPDCGITIDPADGMIVIRTPVGDRKAYVGDWIVHTPGAGFHPMSDAVFRETYEPAADIPGLELYADRYGELYTPDDEVPGLLVILGGPGIDGDHLTSQYPPGWADREDVERDRGPLVRVPLPPFELEVTAP